MLLSDVWCYILSCLITVINDFNSNAFSIFRFDTVSFYFMSIMYCVLFCAFYEHTKAYSNLATSNIFYIDWNIWARLFSFYFSCKAHVFFSWHFDLNKISSKKFQMAKKIILEPESLLYFYFVLVGNFNVQPSTFNVCICVGQ